MGKLTRRFRSRDTEPQDLPADVSPVVDDENSAGPVERLASYSLKQSSVAANESRTDDAEEPAEDIEQEGPPDAKFGSYDAVGDEVGEVLKSAHEAAGKIRAAAQTESERLRTEAESAAAAELADARREADEKRAEAERLRTHADTYGDETRASAEAYMAQRKQEAEREAAAIVAEAEKRLRSADSEVEERVRQATSDALRERSALEAQIGHFEERLERMLVVFRAMTAQLEDVLVKRHGQASEVSGDADDQQSLTDALERSRSTSG